MISLVGIGTARPGSELFGSLRFGLVRAERPVRYRAASSVSLWQDRAGSGQVVYGALRICGKAVPGSLLLGAVRSGRVRCGQVEGAMVSLGRVRQAVVILPVK